MRGEVDRLLKELKELEKQKEQEAKSMYAKFFSK